MAPERKSKKGLILSIVGYFLLELILLDARWVCDRYDGEIMLSAFAYYDWLIRIASLLILLCAIVSILKNIHQILYVACGIELLFILLCAIFPSVIIPALKPSGQDILNLACDIGGLSWLMALISVLITIGVSFWLKCKKLWLHLTVSVLSTVLTVLLVHIFAYGLFGIDSYGARGIGICAVGQPIVIMLPVLLRCFEKESSTY